MAACAAPTLWPADQPYDGVSTAAPLARNRTLGRDLPSRLLLGARTLLVIGLVANDVAIGLGVGLCGLLALCVSGRAHALHRPDDGLPRPAPATPVAGKLAHLS